MLLQSLGCDPYFSFLLPFRIWGWQCYYHFLAILILIIIMLFQWKIAALALTDSRVAEIERTCEIPNRFRTFHITLAAH